VICKVDGNSLPGINLTTYLQINKVASAFQHKYDPYETIQYTKKTAIAQNNALIVQPFPY